MAFIENMGIFAVTPGLAVMWLIGLALMVMVRSPRGQAS